MGGVNKFYPDLEDIAQMMLDMCDVPHSHFYNPKSDLFFDERKYLDFKRTLADFADSVFDNARTKTTRIHILYNLATLYWKEQNNEKDKEYAQEMYKQGLNYLKEAFELSKRLVTNAKYEKVKEDYRAAAFTSYELSSAYMGDKKEKLLNFSTSMFFESFNFGKTNSSDYYFLANVYWERAKFSDISVKEEYYDLARLNYEKSLAISKKANKNYLFSYGFLLAEYSEESLSLKIKQEMKNEAVNVFLYYDNITGKSDGAEEINDFFGDSE